MLTPKQLKELEELSAQTQENWDKSIELGQKQMAVANPKDMTLAEVEELLKWYAPGYYRFRLAERAIALEKEQSQ